jgi:hypothetical protein
MSTINKNTEITRLKEMTVGEVSMVDKGANKRQWIMKKRDSDEGKLVLLFEKANEGDQEAISGFLKSWKIEDATLTEAGFQKAVEPTEEPEVKPEEEPEVKTESISAEDVKKMVSEGIEAGLANIAKNTEKPAEEDGSQSEGDDGEDKIEKMESDWEVIGLQEIE